MINLFKKTGFEWIVKSCEKSFAMIRKSPKNDLNIIDNVDKLKSDILEKRVADICVLTSALLDGIIENLSTIPNEISKYSAIFYQEKCYLPNGKLIRRERKGLINKKRKELDKQEMNMLFKEKGWTKE